MVGLLPGQGHRHRARPGHPHSRLVSLRGLRARAGTAGKFPGATCIAGLFRAREHLHDLARSPEFMPGDRTGEWLAARLEDPDYQTGTA